MAEDCGQGAASVLVWDHFELRAVGAACAALLDTGDESLRKGRIIAGNANGHDLSLNVAKVRQTVLSSLGSGCPKLRRPVGTVHSPPVGDHYCLQ